MSDKEVIKQALEESVKVLQQVVRELHEAQAEIITLKNKLLKFEGMTFSDNEEIETLKQRIAELLKYEDAYKLTLE